MSVIDFANERLNECCANGNDTGAIYWSAYLDGAKAQKKESEREGDRYGDFKREGTGV